MIGRVLIAMIAALAIAASPATAADIIKVRVAKEGTITIDEKPATLDQLRARLAKVKSANGAVWYYREAPDSAPTDAQLAVFKAIIDTDIPISLSTKPDFSDYVGEDGQTHPRQ